MHTERVARVSLGARARRVAQWQVVGRAEEDLGRRPAKLFGLRSELCELSERMTRSACRSRSRDGGMACLRLDLEVGRESVWRPWMTPCGREKITRVPANHNTAQARSVKSKAMRPQSWHFGFMRSRQAPSQAGRAQR